MYLECGTDIINGKKCVVRSAFITYKIKKTPAVFGTLNFHISFFKRTLNIKGSVLHPNVGVSVKDPTVLWPRGV